MDEAEFGGGAGIGDEVLRDGSDSGVRRVGAGHREQPDDWRRAGAVQLYIQSDGCAGADGVSGTPVRGMFFAEGPFMGFLVYVGAPVAIMAAFFWAGDLPVMCAGKQRRRSPAKSGMRKAASITSADSPRFQSPTLL